MNAAVIGAGFSGMLAAYLLEKSGVNVTIFEKKEYTGGHCRTLVSKDVFSELGTAFSFTKNIKELLIELDIDYTEQFVYKKFIDENYSQVEQLSKNQVIELLKEIDIIEEIYIRYNTSLFSVDYSYIDPDLLIPYSKFCELNSILNIAEIIKPFLSSFGFGSADDVPAYYVLKVFNIDIIKSYINGSKLLFFKKGSAQVIKRLSRNISDIRYSMEVKRIISIDKKVVISTDYSQDEFDHVFISSVMDKSVFNNKLYYSFMENLKTNEFFTVTFEVENNDSVSTYYKANLGLNNKLQFFHIIRKSDRTILVAYAYGNGNKNSVEGIKREIEAHGITISKLITIKSWNIFPHLSVDSISPEIYRDIIDEGKNGSISLIGSLVSEPSLDNLYLSVKDRIDQLTKLRKIY